MTVLTLKWLSGARAKDKTKQYYCCFLFFLFYSIMQFKENSLLTREFRVKLHLKRDFVQFNAEFTSQVMNFPVESHVKQVDRGQIFTVGR